MDNMHKTARHALRLFSTKPVHIFATALRGLVAAIPLTASRALVKISQPPGMRFVGGGTHRGSWLPVILKFTRRLHVDDIGLKQPVPQFNREDAASPSAPKKPSHL